MKTYTEQELNKMIGMSADELEQYCKQYEDGSFDLSSKHNPIYGTPLDYFGTKRETFCIDNEMVQKVVLLAKKKGCTKSEIYRQAVKQYVS